MGYYDIENSLISIAYCMHCGHEVGVKVRLELTNPEKSKIVDDIGRTNNLILLDKVMKCCKEPSYSYR